VVLLLLAAGAARAEDAAEDRVLHACEDEEGYPPFAFAGAGGEAIGYSVDLLDEALSGTGLRLDVAFLPTIRCNASIDSGAVDLSMEDFWDAGFAARWRITDSIYDGTFGLFYSRERHPDGLVLVDVLAHPEQHHGCGLLGAVYDDFPPGQIDGREHSYADALERVLKGECAFFPDLLEFGAAYRLNGRRLLKDPRISFQPYPLPRHPDRQQRYDPGDKQSLYFYLRRDFPDGEALIARINDTIARWRRSGKTTEEMARFVDLRDFAVGR
jgi:ABC-type amino acid transport substrate-binding protein